MRFLNFVIFVLQGRRDVTKSEGASETLISSCEKLNTSRWNFFAVVSSSRLIESVAIRDVAGHGAMLPPKGSSLH